MDLPRKIFLALAAVLFGIGVLMVYSASVTSRPTDFEQVYLTRQLGAAVVGLLAAAVAATRPPEFWRRIAPLAFWGVLLLLVLVLVPGIGVRTKGAQRWLRVAGVSVQPSELAKLALPLMMAAVVTTRRTRLAGWWSGTVGVLWPAAIMVPLVLVEPDLGTAAFLAGGVLVTIWVGGWPRRNFAVMSLLAVPMAAGVCFLKPYQQRRLIGFVETWSDFNAAPYQLQQSLVTLGAGGWTGTGLGKGWQKLSFLPEANTDFVFAVIGEELGLLGTVGLVVVWCGLYVVGVRMLAAREAHSFPFLAGLTLLTQLVLQAWFNVAVVTALVPPKGIAHPLISAGGSSLVVSLIALGMVWSLSRPAISSLSGGRQPPEWTHEGMRSEERVIRLGLSANGALPGG
jgi:cell division protein FtsW